MNSSEKQRMFLPSCDRIFQYSDPSIFLTGFALHRVGCSRLSKTRSAVTETLVGCTSDCTHTPFQYQRLQTVLLLTHSPPTEPCWVIEFLLFPAKQKKTDLDVSENSGTPKSSILIGFSITNHPFWGSPSFGITHLKEIDGLGWLWKDVAEKFTSESPRKYGSWWQPGNPGKTPPGWGCSNLKSTIIYRCPKKHPKWLWTINRK